MVWVVDSAEYVFFIHTNTCSSDDRLENSRELLHQTLSDVLLKDAILLVCANKQDLPNAKSASKITEVLDLNKIQKRTWKLQATCAKTAEGLNEGNIVFCNYFFQVLFGLAVSSRTRKRRMPLQEQKSKKNFCHCNCQIAVLAAILQNPRSKMKQATTPQRSSRIIKSPIGSPILFCDAHQSPNHSEQQDKENVQPSPPYQFEIHPFAMQERVIVIDIETTDEWDTLIEIACVEVQNNEITGIVCEIFNTVSSLAFCCKL